MSSKTQKKYCKEIDLFEEVQKRPIRAADNHFEEYPTNKFPRNLDNDHVNKELEKKNNFSYSQRSKSLNPASNNKNFSE
jgi:hypothetical protein